MTQTTQLNGEGGEARLGMPERPMASKPTRRATRHGRHKSSLSARQRNQIVVVSALGALAAAVFSSAAPTGHGAVDFVYRAGFAVLTVLAASRARRWSLVIASGLMIIGSTTVMLIPAMTTFAIASFLAWRNRRDRVLGAVLGALVSCIALNLVWPTSTGGTALLAGAAVLPLWASGYRVARSRNRRRIRWALLIAAIIALVGSLSAVMIVLTQRDTLNTAAAETIAAAKGMTGATTQESARKFHGAAKRFANAASAADAPWALPVRLVPVVSQNVAAVRTAATAGARVNTTAAEIAGNVDYDRLQLDGGGIDLGVLSSFGNPVKQAESVLSSVDEQIRDTDSPWLLGPLAAKLDDFAAQTGPLRNGAEIAALAVKTLPEMLGGSGERRYLLMLGNPAEARDIGGHIGTFAELTANNGVLKVSRVVSPYELYGPGSPSRPQLRDPNGISPAMLEMNPTRFPQNWGASPDMSVVADVAAQLFPQTPGGAPLDGVLYADPMAFAAVLKLVGPVQLSNVGGVANGQLTVDSSNAVAYLTRDQFAGGEDGQDPAKELVRTALDRLTSNRLPAIATVLDSLGPAVESGRLQLQTLHRNEDRLLRRVGLDQPFQQPKGGDLLAVIDRSGFPSKIDAYLQRSIDYKLSWDPGSGSVNARVEITLHNKAPIDGLQSVVSRSPEGTPAGTNRTVLSVVSPFDAVAATMDGADLAVGSRPENGSLKRHSFVVDIPPGESRTVRIDLQGSVLPGSAYRLRYYNQPLVNEDESSVAIRSTGSPFVGGMKSGTVSIGKQRMVDLNIKTAG